MTRLLWLGLLEGPSGYADEARAYLRALEAAGLRPAAGFFEDNVTVLKATFFKFLHLYVEIRNI